MCFRHDACGSLCAFFFSNLKGTKAYYRSLRLHFYFVNIRHMSHFDVFSIYFSPSTKCLDIHSILCKKKLSTLSHFYFAIMHILTILSLWPWASLLTFKLCHQVTIKQFQGCTLHLQGHGLNLGVRSSDLVITALGTSPPKSDVSYAQLTWPLPLFPQPPAFSAFLVCLVSPETPPGVPSDIHAIINVS